MPEETACTTTAALLTRTTSSSSLKESVNHVPVETMRSGTVTSSLCADGDGICDDVDDCVGAYDECGICNGPGAIYRVRMYGHPRKRLRLRRKPT